ncbi:DUF4142 domain-containing protein [Rhizobium rhizosphaerae]|nr:DUF4142 domain-containing protein [Xaviernesmea rhizosphaerae]
MTMIRAALLGATLALAPAFAMAQATPAAQAAPAAMPTEKAEFAKMAGSSNQFEIESSRLALERAQSADVKTFARQMVEDHTKAGKAMMKAAAMKRPADPTPALAPKHAAMLEQLQGAKRAQFQMLYVDMQVQAHEEAVALFTHYAKNGDDAALKSFAAETLPVLEMHRKHVMQLAKKK